MADEKAYKTELGRRLKLAIDARGYTQNRLAREAAIPGGSGWVSSVISGRIGKRNIDAGRFLKLANILDVSYEWLTAGAGTMDQPKDPWVTRAAIARANRERYPEAVAKMEAHSCPHCASHSRSFWLQMLANYEEEVQRERREELHRQLTEQVREDPAVWEQAVKARQRERSPEPPKVSHAAPVRRVRKASA